MTYSKKRVVINMRKTQIKRVLKANRAIKATRTTRATRAMATRTTRATRTLKPKTGPASSLEKVARRSAHVKTVAEVIGEEAVPIVQFLKGKKNISEFQIADSIKSEVNTVRKMLYAMQTSNLVSYYRKKDRQKGWYISYWTLKPSSFEQLSVATKKHKLQQLKERLVKEEQHEGLFYICPSLCTRLEFEKAAEVSFTCPECGTTLQHQDNSRTIEMLKGRIKEIGVK
jgi:transcription initiation factor TFIIE subunit alpha